MVCQKMCGFYWATLYLHLSLLFSYSALELQVCSLKLLFSSIHFQYCDIYQNTSKIRMRSI